MNFYQFLIPRLNGEDIESDFSRYLELVKKGVAGFIVFGGDMEPLREGIRRLQKEASLPLIIASDLEQGLGQQVRGGTLFPPAMAVTQAEESMPGLARRAFECMAREASYAGINTIFAPVLDVNTNPQNPVISTRAFSAEPEAVSSMGTMMVRTFIENGITPCGKHFPGHGSTSVDSHLALPAVEKSLEELEDCELKPFRRAIAAGVPMVMPGHLAVPALDPTKMPVSISRKAIAYLKEAMGFSGVIVTDAMDMGGLGSFSPVEASLMALEAGADLLLHPADPDGLADGLQKSGRSFGNTKLNGFRKSLSANPASVPPQPHCGDISDEISKNAIRVEGRPSPIRNPFVLLLSDDNADCSPFLDALKARYPSLGHRLLTMPVRGIADSVPRGADLIVAVYSRTRAFKGGAAPWIREAVESVQGRASAVVSFGNPYLIDIPVSGALKIFAWWEKTAAQLAAANILLI